jgi:hypothetical protein
MAVTFLRLLLALGFVGFGLLGLMINGYFTPIAFSVSGVFLVTWAIVSLRWIHTLRKWRRAMLEKAMLEQGCGTGTEEVPKP